MSNASRKVVETSLPRSAKKSRTMSTTALSLSGYPVCKLVKPGECQFTEDWTTCKLIERVEVSSTSSLLRFDLPNEKEPLNLSTCACILAKAELPVAGGDGNEAVIRPYTPVSTNDLVGSFDLLVKNYGEHGRMSTHLCKLDVGKTVAFKHIQFNVKIQAPFAQKKIGMIVGGTGITPMVQALHAILGSDAAKTTKVSMLYGSKVSSDILGEELLDNWAEKHSDCFSLTHVLSDEPEDSSWAGKKGFINKDLIAEHLPPPSEGDNVIIFVCGPPPMYNALCGPRDEKELTGVLAEMGYEASQVYKF
eukprot:CAMPEP_0116030662 /NCGR_PEP_ID=MMETSP0321-20121206/16996_1 /TAXON_ID=163516 /ORGANISM="Leptocylindrus danicus var. danicus, Strain B650" /LENGTH=305 /DNA_ID=CAMNT_0003505527 /DNA_START=65 /DNA_END=982 /DNA_ORIENTATION=-